MTKQLPPTASALHRGEGDSGEVLVGERREFGNLGLLVISGNLENTKTTGGTRVITTAMSRKGKTTQKEQKILKNR